MPNRTAARAAALSCLLAAATTPILAQCELEWLPGPGYHGTSGNQYGEHIWSMHRWDRDGAGPAPMRLVFGGPFPSIGPIAANRIASWDPATGEWAPLGIGINSTPRSFATAANGDLLVGHIGVSRWSGTAWSQVGPSINGAVNDLAVMPNGDIVAVGNFTTIGGAPVSRIARWNGSVWSALGTGAQDTIQTALALPNGELVVGGDFLSIGGVAANRIARWDGTSWHALGGGLTSTSTSSTISAFDLALRPNGDVVVAGSFTHAGGVASTGIAGWDGASWYGFGGGVTYYASCVHVEETGDLLIEQPVIAGMFDCLRWNGVSWQAVAAPTIGSGLLTTLPGGGIVKAGQFTVTDPTGTTLHDVARWDGSNWVELHAATTPWFSPALEAPLRGIAVTTDGSVYVTGTFQIIEGLLFNGIARWNGSNWERLGSPLGIGSWPLPYPFPFTMIATRNDDIVVVGRITGIAGGPAGHIARWNGTSWDNLNGGVGANGSIGKVVELHNGDIVVSGDFTVANGGPANWLARYDGSAWFPLGVGPDSAVADLLVMPDGDLVAVGDFHTAAGPTAQRMARWNGSSWAPIANAPSTSIIELLPDGDIVAVIPAAPFSSAWSLQRWNGSSWSQMGPTFATNQVSDVIALPNGDVLVSTYWGAAASLRLHGSTWTQAPTTDISWLAHAWAPDGDLVVAGDFRSAGQWRSPYLARLRSTCAASATATGAGCTGSGGANQLEAANLPWLGSRFRAAGTGLPTLALVSQVWGFTAMNLPLSALLPQAPPGCDLLVTPDYVEFALTTDGTIETSVVLPANPALVGVQLHHQLNLFEIDPSLNLLEVTASNALLLTTGIF